MDGHVDSGLAGSAPTRRREWACAQFARAFFRYALRPALVRAGPIYAAVLLVAGLALQAEPLHRVLNEQQIFLPVLAAAWSLMLSYARGPLFGARQTEYLRWLPVPNTVVAGTVIVALICLDTPWVLLCLASGDPGVMVAGPLLTGAVHTALGSRRRGRVLAALGLLALGAVAPLWLVAPAALVIAGRAAPLAWNVTHTGRVTWRHGYHLPVPWVGITRALVTAVILAAPQIVRRGLAILALLIAMATLAVRNNAYHTLDAILTANLIVLGIGFPFLTSRVTAGVIEKGWALGWLYDATGTRRWTRTWGGLAVTLSTGSALGCLHGLAVALLSEPSLAWRVAAVGAAAGGGLAVLTLGLTAAAVKSWGIDPGLQAMGLWLATILVPLTVGNSLRVGLLLGMPAMVAAIVVYHGRVTRPPAG